MGVRDCETSEEDLFVQVFFATNRSQCPSLHACLLQACHLRPLYLSPEICAKGMCLNRKMVAKRIVDCFSNLFCQWTNRPILETNQSFQVPPIA